MPNYLNAPEIATIPTMTQFYFASAESKFDIKDVNKPGGGTFPNTHMLNIVAGDTWLSFTLSTDQLRELGETINQRLAVVREREIAEAQASHLTCNCIDYAGDSDDCPVHPLEPLAYGCRGARCDNRLCSVHGHLVTV